MAAADRFVVLLCPEAYGAHGGVQAYTRRLAEILSDFGDRFGYGLNCVSYLDSSFDPAKHARQVRYRSFLGSGGSKIRFIKNAEAGCMKGNGQIAVVAHIGQAPVAWALKAQGLIRGYVLVLHGIEAWHRVSWFRRLASAGADRIVATTRFTAERFCSSNGISQQQLSVIPLSLPESDIPVPNTFDTGGPGLRVLSVGRITAADNYKGFDTLIDAVHALRIRGVAVALDIVGTGDDVGRLVSQTDRLGLSDAVHFAGAVPDDELHRRFQECDVFALPSRAEGYGIVFLEAMRHGKPCIGGRHGGTPELLSDGVNGFLVEHGNVGELAERLAFLAECRDARAQMGRRAFDKVRAQHLYPRMKERWCDLLAELTEGEHVRNCRVDSAA